MPWGPWQDEFQDFGFEICSSLWDLPESQHLQVESEWSVLWLPLSTEMSPSFALSELRAQHILERYSSTSSFPEAVKLETEQCQCCVSVNPRLSADAALSFLCWGQSWGQHRLSIPRALSEDE